MSYCEVLPTYKAAMDQVVRLALGPMIRRVALLFSALALCFTGPVGAATPAERYVVDTTANTVTDARSGLVWQRLIKTGTFTWDSAKAQCTGGFRLPALKELLTIVDPTRTTPSIDPAFRGESESQNTPAEYFWSASLYVGSSGYAWIVSFASGNSGPYDTATATRVRCVR